MNLIKNAANNFTIIFAFFFAALFLGNYFYVLHVDFMVMQFVLLQAIVCSAIFKLLVASFFKIKNIRIVLRMKLFSNKVLRV